MFNITKQQLLTFIALYMMVGTTGVVFSSMPFIFYSPKVRCLESEQLSESQLNDNIENLDFDGYQELGCNELQACDIMAYYQDQVQIISQDNQQTIYSIVINTINNQQNQFQNLIVNFYYEQPLESISKEYNLTCENKIKQSSIQSTSFGFQIIGALMGMFLRFSNQQMKYIYTVSTIFLPSYRDNLTFIGCILGVCFVLLVTCQDYSHESKYMDNNINNTKTSYVSQFSAPMRINKFSMLNEGNNQQLILDDIRQSFIGQDYDQVHQIDNRQSENSDQQGQKNTTIEQNEQQFSIKQIFFEFYDNLIDIKNNPDLVKNTFVWVISFSCGIFSYTTCTLVLDQLEGNLYVNSIGFSLLELLGGILSGWIIFLGWNLKKTLQVNFFFQGLIYLITMVFINTQVKAENLFQTLMSIAPILVAKLSFELIWTLLMTYLRDIMYVKYQLFVVSIAQVFSKVLNCIIPFYMYFAESMGINKFLLCTVLCLYCAYLSRNYKKTQDIQFVRKAQNENANLIEMCNI